MRSNGRLAHCLDAMPGTNRASEENSPYTTSKCALLELEATERELIGRAFSPFSPTRADVPT